jgi:hypothetical protein
MWKRSITRIRTTRDAGMTTAEYAVGTLAPVGRLIRSQRPVFTGLHCVSYVVLRPYWPPEVGRL